jgi:hypothetical protein
MARMQRLAAERDRAILDAREAEQLAIEGESAEAEAESPAAS